MKKPIQFFMLFLCLVCLTNWMVAPASAVIVDANTSGGNTGSSTTATGGYSIPDAFTATDVPVFAMRFSVYNTKTGKSSKSIDVINTNFSGWSTHINNQWVTAYSGSSSTLWNHKQWAENPVSTLNPAGTGNVTYSSELNVVLPSTASAVKTAIQTNIGLLNTVLSQIGYTGSTPLSDLTYYDKILYEPVYPVTIGGTRYNMTVAEIGVYGYNAFGPDVAPATSAVQESWGFIADYTNRHFPNAVYAGDGSDVFPSCSALTSNASFRTLLNYGYGTEYPKTKKIT